MQEQTEEAHEEYPWTYDVMYNFKIKVCVTKALSDFLGPRGPLVLPSVGSSVPR